MAARNWDRERRDRPRRQHGGMPAEDRRHAGGRAPKGPYAVSFAAIAMLVDALDLQTREQLARTACGGVLALASGAPDSDQERADAQRRWDAELDWLISTGPLKATGRRIAGVADAIAVNTPAFERELHWLARSARQANIFVD